MTGCGLRTAPGRVAFAVALGETGRDPQIDTGLAETAFGVTGRDLLTATGRDLLTVTGRFDSVCVPLPAGEVAMTVRGHAIPLAALVTARGHVRGLPPPLTARDQRREDDEPDLSNRSVWRQLLSLERLLQ